MKLIYGLLLAFGLTQTEAKTTTILKEYCFAQDYQFEDKYEYYLLACCIIHASNTDSYTFMATNKEITFIAENFKMISVLKDKSISFLLKGNLEDIDFFLINFEYALCSDDSKCRGVEDDSK